jgi:hypothetical protein
MAGLRHQERQKRFARTNIWYHMGASGWILSTELDAVRRPMLLRVTPFTDRGLLASSASASNCTRKVESRRVMPR